MSFWRQHQRKPHPGTPHPQTLHQTLPPLQPIGSLEYLLFQMNWDTPPCKIQSFLILPPQPWVGICNDLNHWTTPQHFWLCILLSLGAWKTLQEWIGDHHMWNTACAHTLPSQPWVFEIAWNRYEFGRIAETRGFPRILPSHTIFGISACTQGGLYGVLGISTSIWNDVGTWWHISSIFPMNIMIEGEHHYRLF